MMAAATEEAPRTSVRGAGSARADLASSALADELAEANQVLEGASPQRVIAWTYERFGEATVLTSSFQDCVLVDLAAQVRHPLRVVFLDTGFHFPETLAYLEEVKALLGLEVDIVSAGLEPDVAPCGADGCCELRKVAPLRRLLVGKAAWITGLKRVDTPERANAPTVSFDVSKNVVKVNPLASWTEQDVDSYVESRGLPRHPLNALGYRSIGCAPTTRPVGAGEDPRAGRFGGERTECGLHL
jgi:phosphoadenosine phosphosulfate reductase